jgi:hypothetical protein
LIIALIFMRLSPQIDLPRSTNDPFGLAEAGGDTRSS